LQAYDHGGDIYGNPGVTLDFSVNTNPLGLPEEVRCALQSRVEEFARYPDPHCRELRGAIAAFESVPADWILCGNGAADLIYRLCYAMKPQKALVCAPTFSEYERALQQVGCQVEYHILAEANQFALTEKILMQLTPGIDMIFLCHPNNPTGSLIPLDLMERILNRAQENKTLTVIDECFLDFTDGESAKRNLRDMPGLVVLKAFTKMYSMAGLRLGYLLCSDANVINKTNAAAQCWSVSVPAQIAGVAALSLSDWQDRTRRHITEERRLLSEKLSSLGITVFPSDANFLLLRYAKPLYESLLQKGILIRKCENFKGLDKFYYRIGVKTRLDNIRLVEAVKEIING
jgi:threonine-phosphate decarboxylase